VGFQPYARAAAATEFHNPAIQSPFFNQLSPVAVQMARKSAVCQKAAWQARHKVLKD
jgi:hypothetical protein